MYRIAWSRALRATPMRRRVFKPVPHHMPLRTAADRPALRPGRASLSLLYGGGGVGRPWLGVGWDVVVTIGRG